MNKSNVVLSLLGGVFALLSVGATIPFFSSENSDERALELIAQLEKRNGGWSKLRAKKDVQFTYVYKDLAKGTDISTERYIFDEELSWGDYQQHEANVFPGKKGHAIQLLKDGKATTTLDGQLISDQKVVGFTDFLRKANYFWFCMMYKLSDPGVVATFTGKENVNGLSYEKVRITYHSELTTKEQNDQYILYFNTKTGLVDFFYFSLPLFGVQKPVLKMELKYEVLEGLYIATERRGVFPNADGEYQLAGEYSTQNISFNNGYAASDFKL